MKQMNKLTIPFLFLFSLLMTSCNGKEEPEDIGNPIHFESSDYTIMLDKLCPITFTDGGGEYAISVGNPDVIIKAYIEQESHALILEPAKLGESSVTIMDIKHATTVTLHITVENFHLAFNIVDIAGTNTNSFFKLGSQFRLIKDELNSKEVTVGLTDDKNSKFNMVGKGTFDITCSETNIFTMDFALHYVDNISSETYDYAYTLKGDDSCLQLLAYIFGFDWGDSIASSRAAQPAREQRLILTDAANGCHITCLLQNQ